MPPLDWSTPEHDLLKPPMNETFAKYNDELDEDEDEDEEEDEEEEGPTDGGIGGVLVDRPDRGAPDESPGKFAKEPKPYFPPATHSDELDNGPPAKDVSANKEAKSNKPPKSRRRRRRSAQGLPQPTRNATSDDDPPPSKGKPAPPHSSSASGRSREPKLIPGQNYVPIAPDFSDLPAKLAYYRAHPALAREIATNSVNTFRDRHSTPAAEACYWRKLVKGWASVTSEAPISTMVSEEEGDKRGLTAVAGIVPEFYKKYRDEQLEAVNDAAVRNGAGSGKWRGVPFESFWIMKELQWDP